MHGVPSANHRYLCTVALLLIGSTFVELADLVNAADVLTPLDLRNVKVGGEIGRRINVTVRNEPDAPDAEKDFLAPFRAKTTGDDAYTGLGKLINTAVKFAVYTNDGKVIALKNRLVAGTIRSQARDGYIGQFAAAQRMRRLWDICEMGYLVYALTSDYHFFGEKPSLAAARKAADYVIANWSKLPGNWDEQTHTATYVSVTGLERAMLALYRETDEQRYLDFCVRQRGLREWNPGIVIGRRDLIEGHVYACVCRCLAKLELYRLQPERRLLSPSQLGIIHFLTAEDGMAITGAVGQWEIWTGDQDGHSTRRNVCDGLPVRFYDSLLRLQGHPLFGDLMERTIFNTLFAAQSSDGQRIRYFTPLEGHRTYYSVNNYCCPCNYRRIVGRTADDGVLPFELRPGGQSLYPVGSNRERRRRRVVEGSAERRNIPTPAASCCILIRRNRRSSPCNCVFRTGANQGRCGGQRTAIAAIHQPGTFLAIDRRWNTGDQVTLDMPMVWQLVLGRKRQSGRAAVMSVPSCFVSIRLRTTRIKDCDAADLTSIILDPASLRELPADGAAGPAAWPARCVREPPGSKWGAVEIWRS